MLRKFLYSFLLCLFVILSSSNLQIVNAQQKNLSNVNVDDLTDSQVRQFVAQYQASGLPMSQMDQAAQARGMSPNQVSNLMERINKLDLNKPTTSGGQASAVDHSRDSSDSSKQNTTTPAPESLSDQALNLLKSKIFGSDLFRNPNITFEPNLRIATPENYQIGPDDEILINLYGYSEASYNLKVSPEGKINIPYVGLINVANMSVRQATQRIKTKLTSTYKAISSGQTKVDVAIGSIRSIKVILTGEIAKPGSYTLSSFATVMNALYAAGGPSENGSYRKINVIRGGSNIATVDIYSFLMTGELDQNIRLQDGDVIRVPSYESRVELVGEVKRPGIFEILKDENFANALDFAGGFNEYAYKARVKVLQNTDTERKIQDITVDNFESYHPMTGDKIYVDKILDRFANKITISGAVFRPGDYSLNENPTLKTLLQHAEGIKEDAYTERAFIVRKKDNSEPELVSFNLKSILNGGEDITLRREDSVQIKSIYDLKETYTVKVMGQVREPGEFNYVERMTLNDLILRAGGLKENASKKRIEIARRVTISDTATNNIAKIIELEYDENLSLSDKKYKIQPFDIISIRPSTGYVKQRQVLLQGEVKYPGYYTLLKKDERISDIIDRAGGLSEWAYAEGASLRRTDIAQNGDTTSLMREKERLKLLQFSRLQQSINDTTKVNINDVALKNNFIGIDLENILKRPRNKNDIFLKDGDIINIPEAKQTVQISGEVLYPSGVVYSNNKSLKAFVNNAGGFSRNADRKKVYVNYANGGIAGTKKILFFKSYPRIKPGAEIFVPERKEKQGGLRAGEVAGISSAFASIAAIIITVLRR